MTVVVGIDAAGGSPLTLVDGAPATDGAGFPGELYASRGISEFTPLGHFSEKLSSLSTEAMKRPTETGEQGSVERLIAEDPSMKDPEADRTAKMSFGEMMAGYVDVTRLTAELGVVASASSSFTTATGKLLSGS